ncbi:Mitochondrial import inner membrane translocase subunit TIM50 [Vitis vinifera]|uniref:Mitochondrial import inner membrane translocase subunit TIM50 n=1 Tax=Vitis vinifera TaxID=29760 RepID=A0A438DAK8_VITVI|nr:Mitochondrial import inner membrane translocase subunit TIM50 [Vitis vinifera]
MHNGSPNIYFDFPIQCYTHLQNRFWSPRLSFIERIFNFVVNHRKYREHVKDLSCLSKDLRRIVIVDNNPFSFLLQPLNGIPCVPFSAEQPNDKQLLEVLLPLLKHLSLQKDVRPVLYERFHMPDWFQMHGIPASNLTI